MWSWKYTRRTGDEIRHMKSIEVQQTCELLGGNWDIMSEQCYKKQ